MTAKDVEIRKEVRILTEKKGIPVVIIKPPEYQILEQKQLTL
jgi:hypothetical protein